MLFNFIKEETLTQVFFCEYCEIFSSSFFIERIRRLLFSLQFRSSYNLGVKNSIIDAWQGPKYAFDSSVED